MDLIGKFLVLFSLCEYFTIIQSRVASQSINYCSFCVINFLLLLQAAWCMLRGMVMMLGALLELN